MFASWSDMTLHCAVCFAYCMSIATAVSTMAPCIRELKWIAGLDLYSLAECECGALDGRAFRTYLACDKEQWPASPGRT